MVSNLSKIFFRVSVIIGIAIAVYTFLVIYDGKEAIDFLHRDNKSPNCRFESRDVDGKIVYFNLLNNINAERGLFGLQGKTFRVRLFLKFLPESYKIESWKKSGCIGEWRGALSIKRDAGNLTTNQIKR